MTSATLIPDTPSPRIIGFFGTWITRMLRKDFHTVAMARGGTEVLRGLDSDNRPLMVIMNHSSWWDPLIGMYLSRTMMPNRPMLAPMEAEQLMKFAFFRKLGIFGIDPDAPGAIDAMGAHVLGRFTARPNTAFWLTPQGEFTDVRAPIRLRPGAAAVAAKLDGFTASGAQGCRCVAVASELVFWTDLRPEMLLHAVELAAPAAGQGPGSTLDWTRRMTTGLQDACTQLTGLAMARDPNAFDVLLGAGDGRINPLYNLYLTLTGRSAAINAKRRTRKADSARGTPPTPPTPPTAAPAAAVKGSQP